MNNNLALLLVEDDLDLRTELANFMEDFFTTIKVTDNTETALKLYKESPFDLVLTDIQLPKDNGLILVKNIKKIAPKQLIIVMSAYQETEYFLKSIELGIFSFLVKPFNSEELMKTMFKITTHIIKNATQKHETNWITLNQNIKYNIKTKYLYINDELKILSQKEEKLLYILVKNIDGHVSDIQLKKEIWNDESVADSTIRVLIKRVREKLGYGNAITNLKGRGYKLTPEIDKTV